MSEKEIKIDIEKLQSEAEAAYEAGDFAKAEELMQQVVDSGPDSGYGHYLLASISYAGGNVEGALRHIDKSLEISPELISSLFMRGKILIESNEPKKALRAFRSVIKLDPQDHDAYYYLSHACMQLEMDDEAIALLTEAIKRSPDQSLYREAAGTAYFRKMEYAEAYKHLNHPSLIDNDKSEIANIRAECAGALGKKRDMTTHLRRSLELDPDQPEVQFALDELMEAFDKTEAGYIVRKKVAVFASIDSFIGDITDHFTQRYDVRVFKDGSVNQMSELLKWADLAWFEWCDNLLIQATKLPKLCVIICRLHAYEVYSLYPEQVDWSKVDELVCVSKTIKEIFEERMTIERPVSVIFNGLDFGKFPFIENKNYGKKIAYVGHIKQTKGPQMLVQCFAAIHKYDPGYSFHIAGEFGDIESKVYVNDMIKKLNLPVTQHGWLDSIPEWLEDKDYIISSSMIESFQYAISESIARGLRPLIHDWPGNEQFYPREATFQTVEQCVELVKNYETGSVGLEPKQMREELANRVSLEKQLESIDNLMDRYIKEE